MDGTVSSSRCATRDGAPQSLLPAGVAVFPVETLKESLKPKLSVAGEDLVRRTSIFSLADWISNQPLHLIVSAVMTLREVP